jgi:hypothetical protein
MPDLKKMGWNHVPECPVMSRLKKSSQWRGAIETDVSKIPERSQILAQLQSVPKAATLLANPIPRSDRFRGNALERTRTSNPRFRRPMLYPIELRVQRGKDYGGLGPEFNSGLLAQSGFSRGSCRGDSRLCRCWAGRFPRFDRSRRCLLRAPHYRSRGAFGEGRRGA